MVIHEVVFSIDHGANHPGARRDTRENFVAYLHHLFRYAGTRSLALETEPVSADEPLQLGDFFVDPGSPGHAVLLVDVAEDDQGNRIGVIGQGFMPAQEFHLVRNPNADGHSSLWFELPDSGSKTLDTPSWTPFQRDDARRFPQ